MNTGMFPSLTKLLRGPFDPQLLANLLEKTAPDNVADYLLAYDATAKLLKKVLPGNLVKYKVGSLSYARATAAGNVAYTGVGFKPRGIIFVAGRTDAWIQQLAVGMADASNNSAILMNQSGPSAIFITGACFAIYDDPVPASSNQAALASFDADGFTIAWTKVGAPGGTIGAGFIAFK